FSVPVEVRGCECSRGVVNARRDVEGGAVGETAERVIGENRDRRGKRVGNYQVTSSVTVHVDGGDGAGTGAGTIRGVGPEDADRAVGQDGDGIAVLVGGDDGHLAEDVVVG